MNLPDDAVSDGTELSHIDGAEVDIESGNGTQAACSPASGCGPLISTYDPRSRDQGCAADVEG
jgi:hypothetical protein